MPAVGSLKIGSSRKAAKVSRVMSRPWQGRRRSGLRRPAHRLPGSGWERACPPAAAKERASQAACCALATQNLSVNAPRRSGSSFSASVSESKETKWRIFALRPRCRLAHGPACGFDGGEGWAGGGVGPKIGLSPAADPPRNRSEKFREFRPTQRPRPFSSPQR